jgi:hypothetical protein
MGTVSVNPPKTPVTKGSNGIACATIPNVCKMPGPPAPFVPVPLPNIGKSGMSPKDYSQDVTFDGNTVAIRGSTFESMGDIASKGTGGGLISANTHGITKFIGPGSMDVQVEGKNVQLLTDPMLNNCAAGGSPPNAATMLGIMQMTGMVTAVGQRTCPICGATDHEPLEESQETRADAAALSNAYGAQIAAANAAWDADPRPRNRRGRRPGAGSTMLGVVHCKTDVKYADKSGMTTQPLVTAAGNTGMQSHPANTNPGQVGARIAAITGNTTAFQAMWAQAGQYSALSLVNDPNNPNFMPVGYPPGSCAAQGALVLCLDDGGLPKTMTERWHSNQTTGANLWFYQAGATRTQITAREFQPGETVPPCMTCSTVLPWLLCFKKDDPCPHGGGGA